MQASKLLSSLGIAALVALAIGCSSDKLSPTLPSDLSSGVKGGSSESSMLKVTPPTPISPADHATFDRGVSSATLKANTSTAQFSSAPKLTYRFQVLHGNTVVVNKTAAPNGTTESVATGSLKPATTYTWRVRAEMNGLGGPWSSTRTFTTGKVQAAPSANNTADWINIILSAASGINPESSNAMLAIEAKLRSMGFAAVVIPHNGEPSDHKMWINGTAWALICSDNFRSGTYSWCPYIQGAYDGHGYSSCGIPNSAGFACPGW